MNDTLTRRVARPFEAEEGVDQEETGARSNALLESLYCKTGSIELIERLHVSWTSPN